MQLDKDEDAPALAPATLAVHAGLQRSAFGENAEALFMTSGYVQPDSATAARRFAEEEPGFTYSRYGNPTVRMLEERMAALEGAEDAICTGSGMGAILMLCLATLQAGDHVLCSQSMFGSTIRLIGTELARFGVSSSFVSQTDTRAWRKAMRPNTKMLFAETPTNPLTDICDMQALADLAHSAAALLAVDNCFMSPVVQRPLDFGADISMNSGTKFLDGQGRVLGGTLAGNRALVKGKLVPMLRCGGFTLSAFNAWVILKGLETLPLRMQAHSRHALQVAQWLQQHPSVAQVHYPGLVDHPQYALAQRQHSAMGQFMGGGVLSFALRSTGADTEAARGAAFQVMDALQIIARTTNFGDSKSLISHPASTSHGRLSEAQRQAAGIGQNLLRLSVGLEDPIDLLRDLQRGLRQVG